MKIPKYWAKGVARVKGERGEFDLSCWRWSDVSQAEAAQAAEAHARDITQRFTVSQRLDRYAYADRPLREEVIEPIAGSDGRESAIITRNSYGALVLNAARVMFIDIDFDAKEKPGPFLSLRQLTGKGTPPPARYPWPTSTAEIAQRQWERNYEYAANRYTTCQPVKELGAQTMHPEIARIVAIHDQYACQGEGLDLA